jgi:amino acid transporter
LKVTQRTVNSIVKVFKLFAAIVGALFIFISAAMLYALLTHYGSPSIARFPGNTEIIASIASMVTGITLISIVPESFRVKFRRPPFRPQMKPTYGFTTLLAIGIGATIGSPLFIILPVNIVQYAFVSTISLIIAGLLSYVISRIYSGMYRYSVENNVEVIGGPGFVKMVTREKSLRYFISRFSMWLANTALAAFSAIFFFTFTFSTLPSILASIGMSNFMIYVTETIIMGFFGTWFIVNAFYERKYLKVIGYAQIVMIVVIVLLIIYQGLSLGIAGHWNFSGYFSFGTGNILVDILENTGFLFILFFGFQEIQAMVRESMDYSEIPLISRWFKLKPMSKEKYLSLSMQSTVLVALAIMIFNGLTIYAVHPNLSKLSGATIPAIYVVSTFLGSRFQIVTIIAFLLSTITTFVPAFIAASRHLRSLAEEGFFPRMVKNSSWIFTVLLILVLSLTQPGFLVNITDFMVLIALGLISLTPIWLRKISGRIPRQTVIVSIAAASISFLVDLLLFPENPNVVLLGVVAIVLSFMMYDIISTGTIGLQTFVMFLDLVGFLMVTAFPTELVLVLPSFLHPITGNTIFPDYDLRFLLLIGAFTIFINIMMDVFVIERTDYKKKTA